MDPHPSHRWWQFNTLYTTQQGVAEIPIIRRGNSAYAVVEGPTWKEAQANAEKLGGNLVTINDEAENKWVIDNFNLSWRSEGNTIYGPNNYYWTGYTDKNIEGEWEWVSGEKSSFTHWHEGRHYNQGNSVGSTRRRSCT